MKAIADHKKGDSWNGLELLIEEVDVVEGVEISTPLDLTGYTAKAYFKLFPTAPAIFEFSTAAGTLTIPVPLNGIIIFMPRKIDVQAKKYIFDVELISPDGEVTTVYADTLLTWEILQDIT